MTFALLAGLAGHERRRDMYENALTGGLAGWRLLAMGLVWWGGMLWVASTMTWPTHFWTVSILLHALMAPLSVLAARAWSMEPVHKTDITVRVAAGMEGLLLFTALFTAQLRTILTCEQVGTLELKYLEFLDSYRAPLFFVGVVLACVAYRWHLWLATHALLVGIVLFTDETMAWAVPLILGYGLTALFCATGRQGALGRAICTFPIGLTWLMGLMGFSLSGLIVYHKMHLELVDFLLKKCQLAALVLFLLWTVLTAIILRWKRRAAAPAQPEDVPWASAWAQSLAYALVMAMAVAPAGLIMVTKLWPPILVERAAQVEVEKPSGMCHAGYSKSAEEFALLEQLGVSMMRVDFHWKGVQPDPNTWDFSKWDSYLDAAEKYGQRVLALLVFDNNNVETNPEGKKREKYIAPQDVPLYLEYVKRITTRYKDRVYAWEIWNEADIPRFWDGDVDEFYDLAKRTADTVYEIDPAIRLVGTSATGPLGSWTPALLEQMHERGALERVDHPCGHCYVPDPRAYYREFRKLIVAARKRGHMGSVWITEIGDPDGGVYMWRASSDLLAEQTMKAHVIGTSLGIEKLVWYCLRDSDQDSLIKEPKQSENFFGIVKSNYELKPAAHAYRLFAHHCSDSVIRSDLVQVSGGVAARQLRTALYRRENGDSALVLWYEPALTKGASARVRIKLGELVEPAMIHDITSSYTKLHLDDVVDVTETPLFITFKPKEKDQGVCLDVTASPTNEIWLAGLMGALIVGFFASLRGKGMPDARCQ
jgi:glycosyl hydrolase family 39 (putative alpha-L-iduronidase)